MIQDMINSENSINTTESTNTNIFKINTDIVASKPFYWIRFGSIYGLCVLKSSGMLLPNIYEKILLHLGPLTGFVSAVGTGCILKGLRMYVYTDYLQNWIT